MAEKSSELTPRENGVLSESDEQIISTVATVDDNDAFVEKYTEEASSVSDESEATENNATEETEHLRAQIVETRKEMGETIDAIQEKLSLSNISEQVKDQVTEQISNAYETAKDSVYEATLGKVGKFMNTVGKELSKTDFGKTMQNNPFPLLLLGLGVGFLAYKSFSGGKKRKSYRYSYDGEDRQDRRYGGTSTNKSMLKSAQGKIGDAASGAYEGVSNAASSAYGGVTSAASSAYEGVTDVAVSAYSGVGDYAGRAYEKVGDYGTQAREQYDYYIEENPLAVGAVALAVGAAVGFAIPSTSYESDLMGEYSQQVYDKAQTAASGLVDKVKTVATETVQTVQETVKETVKEEAKAQGLTS